MIRIKPGSLVTAGYGVSSPRSPERVWGHSTEIQAVWDTVDVQFIVPWRGTVVGRPAQLATVEGIGSPLVHKDPVVGLAQLPAGIIGGSLSAIRTEWPCIDALYACVAVRV